MKKLAIAAVAAASLTAGVANAYTAGTFSNGVVIPNVIHNGATDTTVVGLVNRSGGVVPVNWTFFDEDSTHVRDGCFGMTNNDYEPFVWSTQSGLGMEGRRGYLVMALGQTAGGTTAATVCGAAAARTPQAVGATARLSANAFQVMTTAKDVVYLPVIDGNLFFSAGVVAGTRNLRTLTGDDVVIASGAVTIDNGTDAAGATAGGVNYPATQTFALRYFIDNATGGNDTSIVVWSSGDQRLSNPTVFMYNDAQLDASVNLPLTKRELNLVNPETIVGRPSTHLDGFIEWTVSTSTFAPVVGGTKQAAAAAIAGGTTPELSPLTANYQPYSVFTYSVISSPAFGAVQTLLGAHHN